MISAHVLGTQQERRRLMSLPIFIWITWKFCVDNWLPVHLDGTNFILLHSDTSFSALVAWVLQVSLFYTASVRGHLSRPAVSVLSPAKTPSLVQQPLSWRFLVCVQDRVERRLRHQRRWERFRAGRRSMTTQRQRYNTRTTLKTTKTTLLTTTDYVGDK